MAHPCDSVLQDGVFELFAYQAEAMSTESLRQFFFSQQFENHYRSGNAKAGFTVPFAGIPLTFGGSNESVHAWEKRSQQQNSTAWDFSQTSWQSLLVRQEATGVLAAWSDCMDAHAPGEFNRIRLSATAGPDAVTVQVRFVAFVGAPVPTLTGIVATAGLDTNAANQQLDGSAMGDTETFILPWVGDASMATVLVTTDVGSSPARQIVRPQSGVAEIVYFVADSEVWVFARNESKTLTTANMHNKPAQPGKPKSPGDGKWMADIETATISVGSSERIQGATFQRTQGPGGHHQTQLTYLHDDRTVKLWVKAWTRPIKYLLTAPVFRREFSDTKYTEEVAFGPNELTFDLPSDAHHATVRLAVGGNLVVFEAGGDDPDGFVRLIDASPQGAQIRYRYEIVTQP